MEYTRLRSYNCRILLKLTRSTIVVFFLAVSVLAQAGPVLVGMGDSIGEGVQGADAAKETQVFSFLNWVGYQMGASFTLPLIKTNFLGVIGNTDQRSRISPDLVNTNVAVSGATVNSLLYDRSDASTTFDINTETDLVLYPRLQSQIEYVESSIPSMVLCWIGNNDALSAALAFGNMNASQLTAVADFERDYIELVNRLGALVTNNGTKVVFANVPNVTDIGFLVDRNTAEQMLGFPVALPDGHYTSIIGVLLMGLLGDAALVNDPNFVLDDVEVAVIETRIQQFNNIIQREADRIGMPVVDVNAKFQEYVTNAPVFFGFPLTQRMFGGMFSLDGVHPSNIGHALIANEFIQTINQAFNMNVPLISQQILDIVFVYDPSIDKDRDGKITGRPGVGLIESLAFLFGVTADPNDLSPN